MHTDFSVHSHMTAYPADSASPVLPRMSGGGSFFVQIMRELSPGIYEASVDGTSMRVRSHIRLTAGQSFYAAPSVDQNAETIVLKVAPEQPHVDIVSFLQNCKLPCTPVMQHAAAVLMAMGVRLDPHLIRRAGLTGLRFTGRETKASEAAAVLLSKNIDDNNDTVQYVLDFTATDADCTCSEDTGETDCYARYRTFLKRFNAEQGTNANWIAVPFSADSERAALCRAVTGCLYFLCDEKLHIVRSCRVAVTAQQREWIFDIQQNAEETLVNVYSDPVLPEKKRPLFDCLAESFLKSDEGASLSAVVYHTSPFSIYSGSADE